MFWSVFYPDIRSSIHRLTNPSSFLHILYYLQTADTKKRGCICQVPVDNPFTFSKGVRHPVTKLQDSMLAELDPDRNYQAFRLIDH